MVLDVPDQPAGWYEASVLLSSRGRPLGSQSLAFVQLADDAAPAKPDGRFGFVATSLPPEAWDDLPDILPMLSAGRVKLALWGPAGDAGRTDPVAFDALLQRLQAAGITPTACLLDLPPGLAAELETSETNPAGAAAGVRGRKRDALRGHPSYRPASPPPRLPTPPLPGP